MQTREFKEKLVKLLSPHMDEKQVEILGEQVGSMLRKIIEGTANIQLLAEAGSLIHNALETLQRQDMVKNIHEFNTSLLEFLNQYLKDSTTAEKITTDLSSKLIKEIQTDKRLYLIGTSFEDEIYNLLRVIPDKKKVVDLAIKYPAGDLYKEFEKKYKNKYAEINEKIDALLEPIFESLMGGSNFEDDLNSLENQMNAVCEMENEVSELIEKGLVDLKKSLLDIRNKAQKKFLEVMPRNISRDEQMTLLSQAMEEVKKSCDKILEDETDKIIKKWCAGKPAEVVKTMNFEMIKTMSSFGTTIEFTHQTLPDLLKNLDILVKPVELKTEEREQVQNDLYQFLKIASRNRLQVLLAEKLVDMDVSDLRWKDAMEDFRQVMSSLPKLVNDDFVNNKLADDVKSLNLDTWAPTAKIISLLKHSEFLSSAEQYARQYEKHCIQLKIEAEQLALAKHQEQLLELNSVAEKINQSKVKALVDAVKNSNQSMFDLFVEKCSLATLGEAIKQVTEKDFITKNVSEHPKYVSKLISREKELQTTSLVGRNNKQPNFFKSVQESKSENHSVVAKDDDLSASLPKFTGI